MTDKSHHPPLPEAFAKLGIRSSVLRGVAEAQFVEPSEIQSLVIPPAMEGWDILGQARTGTGKTAAFGLPLLCKAVRGYATQALILVPTRELAVQVEAELQRLGQFTSVRTAAVYGGQRITQQMKRLKHSPEILVGTPGRVMDLIDRRIVDFANIRYVVLDEVDRMLDIGFRDDIRDILSRVNNGRGRRVRVREFAGDKLHPDLRDVPEPGEGENAAKLPEEEELQTIFVSATIGGEIERLARKFMRDGRVRKLVASEADEKPTVAEVEQCYLPSSEMDKSRLLLALLRREDPTLAIVFTRTKRGAEKLTKILHHEAIDVREIHGNLNQKKRDRVMKGFRESKFKVLVATDLASRGIDVAGVSHIINYDVPEDPEAYVHRIGRTARMGMKGKAFTLVTPMQGEELTRIEGLINMEIPRGEVEGFEPSGPSRARSKPQPETSREAPRAFVASRFRGGEDGQAAAAPAATATVDAEASGEPKRRRRTMHKVAPRRKR